MLRVNVTCHYTIEVEEQAAASRSISDVGEGEGSDGGRAQLSRGEGSRDTGWVEFARTARGGPRGEGSTPAPSASLSRSSLPAEGGGISQRTDPGPRSSNTLYSTRGVQHGASGGSASALGPSTADADGVLATAIVPYGVSPADWAQHARDVRTPLGQDGGAGMERAGVAPSSGSTLPQLSGRSRAELRTPSPPVARWRVGRPGPSPAQSPHTLPAISAHRLTPAPHHDPRSAPTGPGHPRAHRALDSHPVAFHHDRHSHSHGHGPRDSPAASANSAYTRIHGEVVLAQPRIVFRSRGPNDHSPAAAAAAAAAAAIASTSGPSQRQVIEAAARAAAVAVARSQDRAASHARAHAGPYSEAQRRGGVARRLLDDLYGAPGVAGARRADRREASTSTSPLVAHEGSTHGRGAVGALEGRAALAGEEAEASDDDDGEYSLREASSGGGSADGAPAVLGRALGGHGSPRVSEGTSGEDEDGEGFYEEEEGDGASASDGAGYAGLDGEGEGSATGRSSSGSEFESGWSSSAEEASERGAGDGPGSSPARRAFPTPMAARRGVFEAGRSAAAAVAAAMLLSPGSSRDTAGDAADAGEGLRWGGGVTGVPGVTGTGTVVKPARRMARAPPAARASAPSAPRVPDRSSGVLTRPRPHLGDLLSKHATGKCLLVQTSEQRAMLAWHAEQLAAVLHESSGSESSTPSQTPGQPDSATVAAERHAWAAPTPAGRSADPMLAKVMGSAGSTASGPTTHAPRPTGLRPVAEILVFQDADAAPRTPLVSTDTATGGSLPPALHSHGSAGATRSPGSADVAAKNSVLRVATVARMSPPKVTVGGLVDVPPAVWPHGSLLSAIPSHHGATRPVGRAPAIAARPGDAASTGQATQTLHGGPLHGGPLERHRSLGSFGADHAGPVTEEAPGGIFQRPIRADAAIRADGRVNGVSHPMPGDLGVTSGGVARRPIPATATSRGVLRRFGGVAAARSAPPVQQAMGSAVGGARARVPLRAGAGSRR